MFIFKSSNSHEDMATSIYLGSLLNVPKDAVLVVNASSGTFATRGKIEHPSTLAALFTKEANVLAGLFGTYERLVRADWNAEYPCCPHYCA